MTYGRLSSTDFQVARALDGDTRTTDAEGIVVDEIINAWTDRSEPGSDTIAALYAICRRLGINVY